MDYSNNKYRIESDKVMGYKSYSKKRKIDQLLFLNADQYCNLGSDSTKTDRLIAEANSRYIYKLIKSLDYNLGFMLLKYREE
ncbi:MAG: hypothetical protein Unbinned805contig1001_43 [Prokaryotic dsDNA virus sp.]|jgi:hypothetical protein|nr:MAG: hypothetical protein Unbinned805contig1001_43 [Prokaryotic dsDNA virus sp.]|tara:strand:- start:1597 stop:1842 length:246 start_codon:yes stop_codon:yes gene_type:complete